MMSVVDYLADSLSCFKNDVKSLVREMMRRKLIYSDSRPALLKPKTGYK